MTTQDIGDANSKITSVHLANELAGVNVATDDALRDIADTVPYYGHPTREDLITMPSLVGNWTMMFKQIEDAFHKSAEVTKSPSNPDDVIRTLAKEIAIAVHTYVANAVVTTTVDTTVTGTGPTGPVTGSGIGKGSGKLA